MEKETQEIRLNKFLSESGFCSRREADRLIIFFTGMGLSPGRSWWTELWHPWG